MAAKASKDTAIRRRIYYADTDSGGVVYHGAYVRLFEQARTEWAHENGVGVSRFAELGVIFVIAELSVKYRRPLFLDDEIEISSVLAEQRRSGSTFTQEIRRGGELAAEGQVKAVCVRVRDGRPVQIPDELRRTPAT